MSSRAFLAALSRHFLQLVSLHQTHSPAAVVWLEHSFDLAGKDGWDICRSGGVGTRRAGSGKILTHSGVFRRESLALWHSLHPHSIT